MLASGSVSRLIPGKPVKQAGQPIDTVLPNFVSFALKELFDLLTISDDKQQYKILTAPQLGHVFVPFPLAPHLGQLPGDIFFLSHFSCYVYVRGRGKDCETF